MISWMAVFWVVLADLFLLSVVVKIFRNLINFKTLTQESSAASLTVSHEINSPKVSIFIPACNEVNTLRPAIQSLLKQTYLNIEILLIDDRSTDGTSELVDQLAREDDRIRAIHVGTLSSGWLGKIHALEEARKFASGEWFLFTDADVQYQSETLKKAVHFCQKNGFDHLTMVPGTPEGHSFPFLINCIIVGYLYQFFWFVPLSKIRKSGSNSFFGLGAFNLVSALKLKESKGLSWLRMEVSDDFGIARLMNQVGGKSAILSAKDDLSLIWWRDFPEMLKSKDKDFSDYGFSFSRVFFCSVFLVFVTLSPLVALFLGNLNLILLSLVLEVCLLCEGLMISRKMGYKFLGAVFFNFGFLLIAFNLFHSGYKAWRVKGLVWRNTCYPLDELRALQRIKY